MMCSPTGHLIDDGVEVLAARRERILGSWRNFRIDFLPDDSMLCELVEPGRQRTGTDALERSEELIQALRAGQKVTDHEATPPRTDDIERRHHGT